jgi:hypothetical protein
MNQDIVILDQWLAITNQGLAIMNQTELFKKYGFNGECVDFCVFSTLYNYRMVDYALH